MPEPAQHMVDRAVRGEHLQRDARDDDDRQEVREVRHRLHEPFQRPSAHLVQQQRQHDRDREAEDEGEPAEPEGVAEHLPEGGVAEEHLDVAQAHPLLTEDRTARLEAPEGDHVAEHRQIAEDQEEQQRQHGQRVQLPVPAQRPPQAGAGSVPLTAGWSLGLHRLLCAGRWSRGGGGAHAVGLPVAPKVSESYRQLCGEVRGGCNGCQWD